MTESIAVERSERRPGESSSSIGERACREAIVRLPPWGWVFAGKPERRPGEALPRVTAIALPPAANGLIYAPPKIMGVLLGLLLLLIGAILSLPVWNYSAKWTIYPCSTLCGLATIVAMLVIAGVI